MARPGMTIAALEQMLASRQNELSKLHKKRDSIVEQLTQIDKLIGRIGGGLSGARKGALVLGGGKRARNELSLVEAIESVLKSSAEPMGVGEILDAVEATGYRSTSANFRGIINQTLIKERKLFSQASRGIYQLKK